MVLPRASQREHYDLALNFGVCGSFDPAMSRAGTVVHVTADRIAELGAEDGDDFLTIHQLQLLARMSSRSRMACWSIDAAAAGAVWRRCRRSPASPSIPFTAASGRLPRCARRYAPDVERMEGAAFMYACLIAGVPFAQVRAVSNAVERRNRGAWKIDAGDSRPGVIGRAAAGVGMKLSLAFSPCPNDCFMFDAIVHRRIDLEGLEFAVTLADIEALNHAAFAGEAGRHQAQLPRLRLLRRRVRAARCRQRARPQLRAAADLQAADQPGRGRTRASSASRFPASTRPRISCAAWRFPRRRTRPRCSSPRSSRRCSTAVSTRA